ncbi:MAG: coproporphyrinogen-III oxidase family protein [Alphaproteobacteria bacterium]|nr:coproporphyrinogen-III oxidase family protein [Alphaproteobacteria bacterium]
MEKDNSEQPSQILDSHSNAVPSPFPWLEGIGDDSLSTSRGFVFQFPPFPTLPQVKELTRPTAGLYFHIPFCAYKCSFCYYATSVTHDSRTVQRYLDALSMEMGSRTAQNRAERHDIRTMYIGGGTPTILEPEQLSGFILGIRERFDCGRVEEFTVESTPNTLTPEKAAALRASGVTRVSIGVQSFSDKINALNDRHHTVAEAFQAIKTARQAGIDNLNLDLICGLIGETQNSWKETIQTLLNVAPEHVTIYLFSMRPQTSAFKKVKESKVQRPPSEAERVALYTYARQKLLENGYTQTTPNCFVREPRFEHIHQSNAWSSLPLLGFGNSVYSFVDNTVTQNVSDISTYKELVSNGSSPVEIGHKLNARELMSRYCVLRFKQLRVVREDFRKSFGYDVTEVFGHEIERLEKLNLLTVDETAVSLTTKGTVYADDVCRTFYTPNVRQRLAEMEQGQPTSHIKAKSALRLSLA